jgi:hypothetical protein
VNKTSGDTEILLWLYARMPPINISAGFNLFSTPEKESRGLLKSMNDTPQ